MINKLNTPTKLYLLVFIMSVFIIGIGFFGITGMKQMNQDTKTLYQDRVLPMQQLTQIRYAYTTGVLVVSEELDSHIILPSEAKTKIELAQKTIDSNWSAYLKTYLTPEESKLTQQVIRAMANSNKAINTLKQKLQKAGYNRSIDITDGKMYTFINAVIAKINELVQLQIQVSNELYKNNERLYFSTEKKLYVLIFVCLLITSILGVFTIGRTRRFIRDLKISNRKIKEAEEKCRAFLKYAGDSIFVLNQDLRITDVNNSALLLLGYSQEELLEMKISDTMTSEGRQALSSKVGVINKEGGSIHERVLQRKDGSLVDTEVNVRVLEDVGYISIIRDIGDRKKAESSIKESEEKYRYLFQNNPACIIIWDPENLAILEVNDIVLDKYGYGREECINMPILNYQPEEEHEKIKAFVQNMPNSGSAVARAISKHLKKNGEEMLMEISSHNIIYRGKKAVLSLANDITEQLKSRAALRKSEENFRSLIDHAADAIFMVKDNGFIFDVNQSACELVNYTKEELIGRTVLDLHPKETHESIPGTWDTLRKQKSLTDERQLQRKNGTLVDVEISRKMLPDSSGAIAIVRDITERKIAEEKIKQSEANYRQLFDLSPAPMWVIDNKTLRFIQVNQASINNYGYSEEEFANMTIKNISPADSVLNTDQQATVFTSSSRHVKKSGEAIDIETSSIPLVSNGEKKILMVAIDVTEKNIYEQKLNRAAIKVQEEERYEIGGELHDNVCQILATSLIFLGMMKKSLSPESNDLYNSTHEYITLATEEIRNLSHRLAPALFDDETLETAFEELLSNFNAENKYEIILSFDKQSKSYQLSRELQLNLYRILQEQLRNILKHAKATRVEVSVELINHTLHLLIADNGIGFEAKAGKGGIGLANMNRRAQMFSGNFTIDSMVGNGCRVMVEVPLSNIA